MKRLRRAVLSMALIPLAACALSGSSADAPSATGAGNSTGLGTGGASSSGAAGSGGTCNTSACLPPLATPAVWDVQIDPPSSSPYAVLQVLNHDVSTDTSFQVAQPVSVSVTFAAPAGGALPGSANVVLTLPPLIPGGADSVYQSPAIGDDGSSASALFMVPSGALGGAGTISLVPLPPYDQQLPAYSFSTMVAPAISLTPPDGDVLVSGQLTDSVQTTQSFQGVPFTARVFQNGAAVSNAASTQSDGTFQLRVPAAAAANPVTLDLRSTGALPWVVSMPFMIVPGRSLGAISLPAFIPANNFRVAVVDGATGISGAMVRAQAILGTTAGTSTVSGTAQYTASGLTDPNGNVTLPLLPGPGNAPVSYLLVAVPPPGSPAAMQCASVDVLGGGPSGSLLQKFVTSRRPTLTGTIRTSSGTPVPSVEVTAAGTPDGPVGCPPPDPVTATVSTDANGSFSLPLEPGTYQLDYDPPVGAAAPRLTELGVSVHGTTVPHDVNLPAGALVTGYVTGTFAGPVGSATVRFFEPRCDGQGPDCFGPNRTAPWLRARALTDASGYFRMAVPIPAQP